MAKKVQTPKVTYTVAHRFVCEHCNSPSEWSNSIVSGDTDADLYQKQLPLAKEAVEKGSYIELSGLSGKCKHCGKRQSWELKDAKTIMKRSPMMGLWLVGSASFALFFLFGLSGALALFVLGSLGFFLYGLMTYLRVKSHSKKSPQRNTPEIAWTPDTAIATAPTEVPALPHS